MHTSVEVHTGPSVNLFMYCGVSQARARVCLSSFCATYMGHKAHLKLRWSMESGYSLLCKTYSYQIN